MGLSKDADMSPFEAGRKLLSLDSQKLTLNDRIDLVFQDADLVPLLVQVQKRFHQLLLPVISHTAQLGGESFQDWIACLV